MFSLKCDHMGSVREEEICVIKDYIDNVINIAGILFLIYSMLGYKATKLKAS